MRPALPLPLLLLLQLLLLLHQPAPTAAYRLFNESDYSDPYFVPHAAGFVGAYGDPQRTMERERVNEGAAGTAASAPAAWPPSMHDLHRASSLLLAPSLPDQTRCCLLEKCAPGSHSQHAPHRSRGARLLASSPSPSSRTSVFSAGPSSAGPLHPRAPSVSREVCLGSCSTACCSADIGRAPPSVSGSA